MDKNPFLSWSADWSSDMSAFVAALKKEVDSLAKRFRVTKHRAFNMWFAHVALDLDEEDALEATGIEGANDKNIDLFWIDKELTRIIIVQGKYGKKGDGDYRPKIREVDSLLNCLNWLASPQALREDGKPDLAASAEEYVQLVQEGYSVELWFSYAGPKCANVEKHIEVYNQNPDNADPPKSCRHCHIGLLERYHDETIGKAKRLESETVSLLGGSHFEYEADFGEALIATVPATELVRIYEKYEDRLFDRNVRLFLGAKKGSINAGIAETLKSNSDKSNFWAYNNGITLVCSAFKVKGDSVVVEDFCIVNGCQSTRSLVDNKDDLDKSVTVLVRVLAVANNLVDSVIRFTNSQNPIRAWDIASQHKTQRRLKKEFAELSKAYLYITRRGDQPKGSLQKYKNGGKPRQIKLAEVGQYVAAFAGEPVLAYKDKALIFSTRHDRVFPADIKVEEVLFAWVCGEEVKEVVSEYRASKANDADVKILTKGGSIFTMAVLGHVAKLRNGNFWLKQLDQERMTSNLGRQRLRKYARYALNKYLSAVKDAAENRREEYSTLIRSRDFYQTVTDRVTRHYRDNELAGEEWLKNALPKLI